MAELNLPPRPRQRVQTNRYVLLKEFWRDYQEALVVSQERIARLERTGTSVTGVPEKFCMAKVQRSATPSVVRKTEIGFVQFPIFAGRVVAPSTVEV